MGISVEQWRSVTGRWVGGKASAASVSGGSNVKRCNHDGSVAEQVFWFAVLAALLVIGGVELNPGPPINEESPENTIKELEETVKSLRVENDQLRVQLQSQFQSQLQSQLEQVEKRFCDSRLKWYNEKCALKEELRELKKNLEQMEELKQQSQQKQDVYLSAPSQLEPSTSRGNLAVSGGSTYANESTSAPPLRHYKKLASAADTSGQDFEVKMLALLFMRGLRNNYEFYLASNAEAAGSFDDIVFSYRPVGQELWTTTCMQLKHKKEHQLTMTQLFSMSTKSDFSLQKYYKSFVRMKDKYKHNKDLQFLGEFDKLEFVLYTTALSSEEIERQKRKESKWHHVFSSSKQGLTFSLSEEKIVNALKETCAFKKLLHEYKMDSTDSEKEIIKNSIVSFSVDHKDFNVELNAKCKDLSTNFDEEKLEETLKDMDLSEDTDAHEEFLGKLKLFTNQAKEGDLDDIIKSEIKTELQIVDDGELKVVYDEFIDELKKWWKLSDFFLRETTPVWENIISNWIQKLSSSKTDELNYLNITFQPFALQKIIIPKSGVLNIVVTGRSTALSCFKLYGTFQTLVDRRCIFVGLQTLLLYQEKYLCAWVQRWCRCLLIDCEPNTKDADIDQLGLKLQNVFKTVPDVTIILITRPNDILAESLKCDFITYNEYSDDCEWSELTKETQTSLLDVNINFQGIEVPLKRLIVQYKCLTSQLKSDNLDTLVRDKFTFGLNLDSRIKYYVPRKLKNSDTTFDIKSFHNIDSGKVIIAAEPGMGKSTLLTHLAQSAKEQDPGKWVARINLIDCSKYLEQIKNEDVDADRTMEFMEQFCLGGENHGSLEKDLFKHCMLTSGEIIVFFDAFDEICPHYKIKVCEIIRNLLETKITSLWITSRLGEKSDLEQTMSVTSYSLEPFTKSDQHIFLRQFWKQRIFGIEDTQLNAFIEKVLKLATNAFKGDDLVISIPQQTMMLGEYFEDKLESWTLPDSLNVLPITFNILDLYDYFVDKKFENYFCEKKKDDMTNVAIKNDNQFLKRTFLDNHKEAALHVLLSPDEILGLHLDASRINEFTKRINEGFEKSGIIDKNSTDNKPKFIHRTFAEYFVAIWCTENYNKYRDFVKEKVFTKEFKVVRSMFDLRLAKNLELHTAVLNVDLQAIENLLASNIDVDQTDEGGRTALHLVAAYGKSEKNSNMKTIIAKKLLDSGASLNTSDKIFEWRPLHYADNMSSWPIIDLLLRNGGRIEDLIETKLNTHPQVFTLLVDYIKNTKSNNSLRLIHSASYYGELEIIQHLVKEYDANIKDRDANGVSCMHKAAEGGRVEVMQFLKSNGETFTVTDDVGNTPLLLATEYNHEDAMEFLLQRDLLVNSKDVRSLTHQTHRDISLLASSYLGNFQVARLLVKCDAMVNYSNKKGTTPLHFAALKLNVQIVTLLLEKGANVNAVDVEGRSPLFRTVEDRKVRGPVTKSKSSENDRLNIVKLLIKKDACLRNQINNKSYDVFNFAVENGHSHLRDYLDSEWKIIGSIAFTSCKEGNMHSVKSCVHRGLLLKEFSVVRGFSFLSAAVTSGNLELVNYVLEDWPDVDLRCKTDEYSHSTPLMLAAHNASSEIVETLIKHGADVEAISRLKGFEGYTPLHFAVSSGRIDTVKILVRSKSKINARCGKDKTPLVVAVENGHYNIVEYLLKHGADCNAVAKGGNSSLNIAINGGRIDIVRLLFRGDVFIDPERPESLTLLYVAAKEGFFDIVRKLIEQGVTTDAADKDGNTFLHIALFHNRIDVAHLLLDGIKTKVNAKNLLHITPLHLASSQGYLDIVAKLIKRGDDVNAVNLQKNSSLHFSTDKNRSDVVNLLLRKGANVDLRNSDSCTSLHLAAGNGFSNIAELLICAGADIESVDKNKNNPLLLAVFKNHFECVELLLSKGVCVDASTVENATALHFASCSGFTTIAVLLLHFGAAIEAVNKNGDTSLLLAVLNNKIEFVKLLLSKGASVDVRNIYNSTPLHLASGLGFTTIAELLIDAEADIEAVDNTRNVPLSLAVLNNHIHIAQRLIRQGASINVVNNDNNTLLHIVSNNGFSEIAKVLIEGGADIEAVSKNGDNPLMLAVNCNHLRIVQRLLEKGASVNCDKNGITNGRVLLHMAAGKGFTDIVECLLQHGADIAQTNMDGYHALHLASYYGHLDTVKLLLKHGADINVRAVNGYTPLNLASQQNLVTIKKYLVKNGGRE